MTVGVPCPGPAGSFSRGRAVCLPGQLRVLRSEHAPPRGGGGALAPHFREPLLWLCLESPEDGVQTRALVTLPCPRLSAWLVTWAGPAAKPLQP